MELSELSDDALVELSLYRGIEKIFYGDNGCSFAIIAGIVFTLASVIAGTFAFDFKWVTDPWWVTVAMLLILLICSVPIGLFSTAGVYLGMQSLVSIRVRKYHK